MHAACLADSFVSLYEIQNNQIGEKASLNSIIADESYHGGWSSAWATATVTWRAPTKGGSPYECSRQNYLSPFYKILQKSH